MLLKNKYANTRYSNLQEYYCDLTRELDSIIGLSHDQHWKHYILADDSMIKDKILAIRIPGGTIGGVWFNDDNVITTVLVDTEYYVVKKYPKDLNEIIYAFLTIFLYLLKCPQSLILSALRAFCFCGKPHISRSIFLYFRYQAWLKSW